jgi:hypothetical protein
MKNNDNIIQEIEKELLELQIGSDKIEKLHYR